MMIPKIDPDVKYIGSSKLRELTAIELRALTGAIVVTGAQNTPLAVILPYETYLKMQEVLNLPDCVIPQGLMEKVEALSGMNIDNGEFDARRKEIQQRIAQGARRTPRQKGDKTR